MLSGKSNVLVIICVLITISALFETGTSRFIRLIGPKVDIRFCGTNLTRELCQKDEFSEEFECHEVRKSHGMIMLSSIQLVSSPEYANCILLYTQPDCTGDSLTVYGNGTNTIKLEDYKNKTEHAGFFSSRNTQYDYTYEFCHVNKLRKPENQTRSG